MLKFLKKKEEDAPPDVGKEGEEDYKEDTSNDSDNPDDSSYEEAPEKFASRKKRTNKNPEPVSQPVSQPAFRSAQQSFSEDKSNLELEKINARLEVINSMIKSFNERFSLMNQQIGEIRTMSVTNEKNLSISNLDAKKVIELVKEVNPEKLRLDYRRADFKVTTLTEKLEANKQFIDSMMDELKDLKRKANLFEGTDALLKLNEDVKKDLIEIQKTNSRVRMNADKSEQIFIELNKGFQENQKINQVITNLDSSYSGIKKEIEKINLDNKQILNINDFNDFKKTIEGKFAVLENILLDIEHLKTENDKFSNLIQRILFMEKRNEEDIANLGLKSGVINVKKMSDYEQELFSFLELMDKMALEINRIKERVGLKTTVNTEKSPNAENMRKKIINNIVSNQANPANEEENANPFENFEEKTGTVNKSKKSVNPRGDLTKATPEQNAKNGNQNEINDLLFKGENCLLNSDLASAVKIYEEISDLYNPAEDENNLTYPKIIEFYEHLSNLINKPASTPSANVVSTSQRQYKKLSDY